MFCRVCCRSVLLCVVCCVLFNVCDLLVVACALSFVVCGSLCGVCVLLFVVHCLLLLGVR